MPARFRPPRTCRYLGHPEPPLRMKQGTWVEAEAFCYAGMGMHRRARALYPDGKLRIVRCGPPDTFFSVPVRGGGWIEFFDDVVTFHPPQTMGFG